MLKMLSPAFLALMLLGAGWNAAAESPYAVYKSESSFDDVMQALKMAIEEKGMYINNVIHMGEMLERTGKDLELGANRFKNAESIEFCSALLSHKMTAENPARIVNCPYIISVYVLAKEPDATYVVHRRLNIGDDAPVMQEVEELLESLGQSAQEAW